MKWHKLLSVKRIEELMLENGDVNEAQFCRLSFQVVRMVPSCGPKGYSCRGMSYKTFCFISHVSIYIRDASGLSKIWKCWRDGVHRMPQACWNSRVKMVHFGAFEEQYQVLKISLKIVVSMYSFSKRLCTTHLSTWYMTELYCTI